MPSSTTAPAATSEPAPITAPLSTVARMPMRQPSSTVQPWMTAPCPTLTFAPMFAGLSASTCTMTPSCRFESLPSEMDSKSARSTEP